MNDWQMNVTPPSSGYPPQPGSQSPPKPAQYPTGQVPPGYPSAGSYQGGIPVRCPHCSHVVSTRYCSFCGLDLSAYYTVQYPASYPANGGYPQGNGTIPPVMSPIPSRENPAYSIPNGQYGYPPPSYYPPMPTNGAFSDSAKPFHRLPLIISIISVAAIAVIAVVFLTLRNIYSQLSTPSIPDTGYPQPSINEYYRPEGISLEEYQKIKVGMSYAQVSQLIGGDGQEADSGTTVDDRIYYTYAWYGEDNVNAIIYITFVDSAVTDILNEGLTNE